MDYTNIHLLCANAFFVQRRLLPTQGIFKTWPNSRILIIASHSAVNDEILLLVVVVVIVVSIIACLMQKVVDESVSIASQREGENTQSE